MAKNSKARIDANRRYGEKAYDRIALTVKKGKKDLIQEHVVKHGESLNGFLNRAIDETMERDNRPTKKPLIKKVFKPEYDHNGFDSEGYDHDGFDKDGYDREGIDCDGYDREGYDINGVDRNSFDRMGYRKIFYTPPGRPDGKVFNNRTHYIKPKPWDVDETTKLDMDVLVADMGLTDTLYRHIDARNERLKTQEMLSEFYRRAISETLERDRKTMY